MQQDLLRGRVTGVSLKLRGSLAYHVIKDPLWALTVYGSSILPIRRACGDVKTISAQQWQVMSL